MTTLNIYIITVRSMNDCWTNSHTICRQTHASWPRCVYNIKRPHSCTSPTRVLKLQSDIKSIISYDKTFNSSLNLHILTIRIRHWSHVSGISVMSEWLETQFKLYFDLYRNQSLYNNNYIRLKFKKLSYCNNS